MEKINGNAGALELLAPASYALFGDALAHPAQFFPSISKYGEPESIATGKVTGGVPTYIYIYIYNMLYLSRNEEQEQTVREEEGRG